MTLDRFLVILLFFSYGYVSSQNLVNDGSFEDYKRCPQGVTHQKSEFMLKEWYPPTGGTTDYLNECAKRIDGFVIDGVNVPQNQAGYQYARTGKGYVGFLSGKLGKEREYVGAKLTTSLIRGEEYYVEFWVSLADRVRSAVGYLGAYFSVDVIKEDFIRPLIVTPQIIKNEPVLDTTNWVKISGTFKAQGGEKYITIGSFDTDNKSFVKLGRKQKPKFNEAYYYLDDVLVERVKKDTVQTKQFASELNKPIILENITFEFGKSQLKESSFAELNKLIVELQANPNYQITLSGYTDNVGQEEDNLKLSEARAKAVAEYLIIKGIDKERITYKGYGSKQPITTNETEQGREQNRRVEFILTQDEK